MFLAFAEYKDQVRFSWQIWCFPFSAEVLLRGPVGIGFVLVDCSTVAVRHFPLLRMLTSLKCTLQPKLQTQFAIAHRFAGWLIVNKLKENKLVIFWTSGFIWFGQVFQSITRVDHSDAFFIYLFRRQFTNHETGYITTHRWQCVCQAENCARKIWCNV